MVDDPPRQLGQHGQRRGLLLRAGVALGREVGADHVGLRDPRILEGQPPLGELRRLLRARPRLQVGVRVERAVVFLGQPADLLRVDVARHHHDRVVGGVVLAIEARRVGERSAPATSCRQPITGMP